MQTTGSSSASAASVAYIAISETKYVFLKRGNLLVKKERYEKKRNLGYPNAFK